MQFGVCLNLIRPSTRNCLRNDYIQFVQLARIHRLRRRGRHRYRRKAKPFTLRNVKSTATSLQYPYPMARRQPMGRILGGGSNDKEKPQPMPPQPVAGIGIVKPVQIEQEEKSPPVEETKTEEKIVDERTDQYDDSETETTTEKLTPISSVSEKSTDRDDDVSDSFATADYRQRYTTVEEDEQSVESATELGSEEEHSSDGEGDPYLSHAAEVKIQPFPDEATDKDPESIQQEEELGAQTSEDLTIMIYHDENAEEPKKQSFFQRILNFIKSRLPYPDIILHCANTIAIVSMFMTDIIALRVFAASANGLAALYYQQFSPPLRVPMLWVLFFAGGHLFMICRRLLEDRSIYLTEQQERVYSHIFAPHGFTAIMFKKLYDDARVMKASKYDIICEEGHNKKYTFLILHGEVEIHQRDTIIGSLDEGFIGDLVPDPNENHWNTTVVAKSDISMLVWETNKLQERMNKNSRLKQASVAAMNGDLGRKLSAATKFQKLHSYKEMMKIAASNGYISVQEKSRLEEYRRENGLSYDDHAHCVESIGWTYEEFEYGRKAWLGSPLRSLRLWYQESSLPSFSETEQ